MVKFHRSVNLKSLALLSARKTHSASPFIATHFLFNPYLMRSHNSTHLIIPLSLTHCGHIQQVQSKKIFGLLTYFHIFNVSSWNSF